MAPVEIQLMMLSLLYLYEKTKGQTYWWHEVNELTFIYFDLTSEVIKEKVHGEAIK